MTTKIENYLKSCKSKGATKSSISNYSSDLKTWIEFNNNKMNSIYNNDNFEKYIYHLSDFKKYSQNTIRRKIQTLRLYLDYLVKVQEIQEHHLPLQGSFFKEVLPPKCSEFHAISLSWQYLCDQLNFKDNFENILATRNLILFLLIYQYGLQVSHLIKLTREDFNLDYSQFEISFKNKSKTFKSSPLLILLLSEFQKAVKKISIPSQQSYLFVSANKYKILNSSITSRAIELIFKNLSKSLNISISARELRNSCIIYWMQEGILDYEIIERLGLSKKYDLKRYKDITDLNVYSSEFLNEFYQLKTKGRS